jgi:hypothetical protein
MNSDTGDATSLAPGFPIRTSSDPRSVDSSPRHNAASHVLHRLPMPRHPPCALKHLQTQNQKLKNTTLKLHIRHQTTHHTHSAVSPRLLPRCSQPLSTNQTPHPTTKDEATTNPYLRFPTQGQRDSGLVVSKPNSVSGNPSPAFDHSKPVPAQRLSCTDRAPTTGPGTDIPTANPSHM